MRLEDKQTVQRVHPESIDPFGFITGEPHPGPPPAVTIDATVPLRRTCDCTRLRYVWRVIGKSKLYGYQCRECGSAVPQSFLGERRAIDERDDIVAEAVPYEDEFTARIQQAQAAYYYRASMERQRLRSSGAWWDWYNRYLASTEWKRLRAAVLRRDRNTCTCGAPAQHVHHETYERVGYESLDDLVSLCVPCHEERHGRRL